jgi:hypothetical protein
MFHELDESTFIETVEGTASGTDIGTVILIVLGKDDTKTELYLNNVIYAPNMSSSLFSLAAAYDKGYETRMTSGYGVRIFHGERLVAGMIRDQGGLFRLRTIIDSHAMVATVPEKTPEIDIKHLASANGPSRRGQRQEIGKDGRGYENKSRNSSGSMRSMFGRETVSATVPQASHKGKGVTQTCSQRSVWANRPNNLRRDELLRPIHRPFYEDDAYLPSEEKGVGRGAGKVKGVSKTGAISDSCRSRTFNLDQTIDASRNCYAGYADR